ncbi:pectinesterase family protein [Thermoflavifilum thermophilum]|uniref:Pectinesterase n=1 Tax=Thermoflavifilum thermophilum TaxID=1393122 RepID=A0A1I7N7V7_9BACT|nr:pectinesterase family protein [Thermoflavifilum thermophilum]SFV30729.1 pectinesterase [Thermoflavifilum thermophilum]
MKTCLLFLCMISGFHLGCLKTNQASSQDGQTNQRREIVVAQDGSGDFTTVQSAISAVPDSATDTTYIYIKNGIYREKIVIPASKRFIKLMGENVDSVILVYGDYASKLDSAGNPLGTSGSASVYIYANDVVAENITFQNDAGPVGQAVAAYVSGDRVYFHHCRFLGFQDTLYTGNPGSSNSRQYYRDCYVEGTTDFIFGSATAVFDSCLIYCKSGGHYITAASTPQGNRFGYVFLHCEITGNAPPHSFYLGRPWRPYARVVYLYCYLDNMIAPEGWSNWHDTQNDLTAYYAEYQNTGPGYQPQQRVAWSHQLTDDEAKAYTLANILQDWKPY